MAKLLIHYGKTGPLKYLSHLELLRAFERSFRRAGLEITLSGGFNPRPKVSYGSALSVGIASTAEYMTLDLAAELEPDEALKRISSALPEGLQVYKAKYIPTKNQSIMSAVQSQSYAIRISNCPENALFNKAIEDIISEDRLLVRHKDKEKWVESKKAIVDWKVTQCGSEDGEQYSQFVLLLSVGGSDTIRPETLMAMLFDRIPDGNKCEIIEICRMSQYVNRDIPLEDIYEFYESVKMGSECK